MTDIVNTCVFSELNKTTIFPWTIVEVTEPAHTFVDFFNMSILPRLPSPSAAVYELKSAFVGPQKTLLDPVDSSL